MYFISIILIFVKQSHHTLDYSSTLNSDLYAAGFFIAAILLILGLSELINYRFGINTATTRKFVHISVGLISAFSPWYFTNSLMPILIATLFTIGNYYMVRKDLMVSIHRHELNNYGTVFFPLSFLFLTLFYWNKPIIFACAMLVMTIADPIASTVGRNVSTPRIFTVWKDNKSIEGSTFMFISTFLLLSVIIIYGSWFTHQIQILPISIIFGIVGLVSIIATFGEMTSRNGFDNLSIPILVAVFLDIIIIQYNFNNLPYISLWLLFSLVIFIYTTYRRWLTLDGCLAAWLIGLLIYSTHGLIWVLPLFVFFISSSILTRMRKGNTYENQTNNGRGLVQVLANSGIATLIALYSFYTKSDQGLLFFLAAIAAATADTWATEIGMRSRTSPIHCITFRTMKPGDSGGVTILGTVGSLLGAFLIGILGLLSNMLINHILLITVAGFWGSIGDSILGGTLQAKYHCEICGKDTEKSNHCGDSCTHTSGLRLINNDGVNVLNTLIAVVFVYIFISFYG